MEAVHADLKVTNPLKNRRVVRLEHLEQVGVALAHVQPETKFQKFKKFIFLLVQKLARLQNSRTMFIIIFKHSIPQ